MKRLAIYAHYDHQGEVKPYVVHYLKALSEHCGRIVFVSTATLSAEELAKVEPHCEAALTKANAGFDFGMWKQVIEQSDLAECDELVLTNSSVFGPLSPLATMFEKMKTVSCDFWGVTDNYELDWHVQSYFLVFRREVFVSDAFTAFWRTVLPYENKRQVIRSYEVGLSCHLREAGFRGEAYVPVDGLFPPWPVGLLYLHKRGNATRYYPVRCIEHGMPFVKVEVLRDNPGRVALKRVYRAVERLGYDRDLIVFDRPVRQPTSLGRRVVDGLLGRNLPRDKSAS